MPDICKGLATGCMLALAFSQDIPAHAGRSEGRDAGAARSGSQAATGRLCIAKVDLKDFSPRSRRADTLEARKKLRLSLARGVDVSVDGGAPVHASPTEGGQISLPLEGRHLISIRRESGRVLEQSFHFSFPGHRSRQLCLWYRAAIYDNWQLDDLEFSQRRNRCTHCALQ